MATDVTICNKALAFLGHGNLIASLSERSAEAVVCNLFFEDVRDMTLKDFEWPFATKTADLLLVNEDPTEEWLYAYRYPSDCLQARRIVSGIRNETEDTKIKYRIMQDDSGLLVYTDHEDAQLEYTKRMTDASLYPIDFATALSLHLASHIAPRITAGDKFKMGERMMLRYLDRIGAAQANAFNEERLESRPESEFVRGRE
jgi:hypothetical protein